MAEVMRVPLNLSRRTVSPVWEGLVPVESFEDISLKIHNREERAFDVRLRAGSQAEVAETFETTFEGKGLEPFLSGFDLPGGRDPVLWNAEIYPKLEGFLDGAATSRRSLLLDFAAHSTIAFAAGYILEAKSGLDITIHQRNPQGGFYDWRSKDGPLLHPPPPPRGAGPFSEPARHPERSPRPGPGAGAGLRIRASPPQERAGILHLFIAGPNAFLFYLGQIARGLERIQMYEYKFESREMGGYVPSMVLPQPEGSTIHLINSKEIYVAELPSYFIDFLQSIRLTENQRKELKSGHETLRKRLQEDETLAKIYVSDFLQGSYRRGTAVRPKGGQRSDVDIIVVTNINKEEVTPFEALQHMRSILVEYYGKEKCTINGRSIGIEMSHVDLDVVLTAAPTESDTTALRSASVKSLESLEEAEDWSLNEYWRPLEERNFAGAQSWVFKALKEPEWKTQPLWIPDREAQCWQPTHPLMQIQRTRDKNKATSRHYINVVKALKWWRRCNPEPKHPKGYPLEHIIYNCCPDGIASIAEGITRTLETIQNRFEEYVRIEQTPDLRDHGVDQNVLHRIEPTDFAKFHEQASEAAALAREALEMEGVAESAAAWRRLLGNEFPPAPESGGDAGDKGGGGVVGGFSERKKPSLPPDGRFA